MIIPWFRSLFQKKRKPLFLFGLIVFCLIVLILGFRWWKRKSLPFFPQSPSLISSSYNKTYRLVEEKISQSAPIKIFLPAGVTKASVEKRIKFYPQIKGYWIVNPQSRGKLPFIRKSFSILAKEPSQEGGFVVFKPEEKLRLNTHYRVELETGKGLIKADFLAVADPFVTNIFPKEEAPENSEITIVFNRPIVPLTSLGRVDKRRLPVKITPQTKGRFKWITTKTLQFQPKDRLKRSSHYTVEVGSGFTSVDGLRVKGVKAKFITRKLRYKSLTKGEINYRQPFLIYFNQPVNLEKTKRWIKVKNNTTGKETSLIVEYKPRLKKSVLQIYNQSDRFGRKKYWDFNSSYTLTVKKAFPLEGDIILNQPRQVVFKVRGVVKRVTAETKRQTVYDSPSFFDPQGKLLVEFFEKIDLNKTKIKADKLEQVGYGKSCKDDNFSYEECEKVTDKRKIYLRFKSQEIRQGEKLKVFLEKVINDQGLEINKTSIPIPVISYPQFRILRVFPTNGWTNADLTRLIICSNTPIFKPPKDSFKDYITANLDLEISSWGKSWRVVSNRNHTRCSINEFETVIYYGLQPESSYSLKLRLRDVFSQKNSLAINFTTGKLKSKDLSFYHFQPKKVVTSSQKTKLNYAAVNMDYVGLDICQLSPQDYLSYLKRGLKANDPPSVITNCQRREGKKIELPRRYWVKKYFQVDIKEFFPQPLGHFILSFSNPDYKNHFWNGKTYSTDQVYERTFLTVTNLAVVEKKVNTSLSDFGLGQSLSEEQLAKLRNFYLVTKIGDLSPVKEAEVRLYQEKPKKELKEVGIYKTDNQGIALTNVIPGLKGAVITAGDDSTVISDYG